MDNAFAVVTDLETTGLDANLDVPLEIGAKIIDKDGNVLGEPFHSLVWEVTDDFQRGVSRGRGNKFVEPMHHKSGLWNDLYAIDHKKLPEYSRSWVDGELVEWLTEHDIEPGTLPMLGNSIGSLDRPFVLVHFPRFNLGLSYRNIDISSFKEMCKAHNSALYERLKPIIGTKEGAPHRVLGDIDGCIREYQAYVDNFFFVED